MRMRNLIAFAVALFCLLGIDARAAQACDCAATTDPAAGMRQADAVFLGALQKITELEGGAGTAYDFAVEKAWKGAKGDAITLTQRRGLCVYTGFESGGRYLVYAHRLPQGWQVSSCSRTARAEDSVLERRWLDILAAGKAPDAAFYAMLAEKLAAAENAATRVEAAKLAGAATLPAARKLDMLLPGLDDGAPDVVAAVLGQLNRYEYANARPLIDRVPGFLDHENERVRMAAAQVLGVIGRGRPDVFPALMRAYENNGAAGIAGRTLIWALHETAVTEAQKLALLPHLRERLRNAEDIWVRVDAAQKIGFMGRLATAAEPDLLAALSSDNASLRQYAATALSAIGSADAFDGVVALLDDASCPVAGAAAVAAFNMRGAENSAIVAGRIEPALRERLEICPREAGAAIAEIGPAMAPLVLVLADAFGKDVWTDHSVAQALGAIGPAARPAAPVLVRRLSEAQASDYAVPAVLVALSRMRFVPRSDDDIALLTAVADRYLDSTASAVSQLYAVLEILGRSDDPAIDAFLTGTAIPALNRSLAGGDVAEKRAAARLLALLPARAAPARPALVAALSDDDPYIAAYAAESLGAMGKDAADAVPPLVQALSVTAQAQIRAPYILQALAKIGVGDAQAVAAITPWLDDDNPGVAALAAQALVAIGTDGAMQAARDYARTQLPLAADGLKHPDPRVRGQNARLFANLSPFTKVYIPQLIGATGDSEWLVRSKAAEALGALGASAASTVPDVAKLLYDRHVYVRDAARAALENIGTAEARAALREHGYGVE